MANDDMHAYWNEGAGPVWVQRQEHLDRQLEDLDARTRARASIADGERVLDVGCGCGASTLELARAVGGGGRVTGVDLSGPMLEKWCPEFPPGEPNMGQRIEAGEIPFWETPYVMWLILGGAALFGVIIAILGKRWFTKGAHLE